ncbi:MAG: hypothetical protein V4621_01600 [Pseudomonadota bacterium]
MTRFTIYSAAKDEHAKQEAAFWDLYLRQDDTRLLADYYRPHQGLMGVRHRAPFDRAADLMAVNARNWLKLGSVAVEMLQIDALVRKAGMGQAVKEPAPSIWDQMRGDSLCVIDRSIRTLKINYHAYMDIDMDTLRQGHTSLVNGFPWLQDRKADQSNGITAASYLCEKLHASFTTAVDDILPLIADFVHSRREGKVVDENTLSISAGLAVDFLTQATTLSRWHSALENVNPRRPKISGFLPHSPSHPHPPGL